MRTCEDLMDTDTETITASEAAVLDVIQRKRLAAIPDVAVLSRLTPSEARNAVQRLQERDLLEHVAPSFFRLTSGGEELVRMNGSRRPTRASAAETLDESAVESRLDEIIKQLS
jgi:DNA-binding IclR family transcriptional regulator